MTRLSYVVVTDGWEPVAELAEALARQTAVSEVELVLVAEGELQPPANRLAVRTVVVPEGHALRAAGVHAAAGDVVALGETHVVPSPGWAEAVLAAHDAGAVAVLPRMRNANPGTALSWAAFLLDYGRYAGAATSATQVPTYNATVLRAALLGLPDLEATLVPGLALDESLRAQGATVTQLSGADLAHVNLDRPVDWAHERLLGGLLLGRRRGAGFGRGRRLAYALASPLIAAVLFVRALRAPRDGAPPATVPALALACVLGALAEGAGYLSPAHQARAERRMLEYETHTRAFARGGP
jgi:hypothetical protein